MSLSLSRVNAVVCDFYEIERQELSRRWSRHPARAALACPARSWTMPSNPELTTMFGLPRREYVPNLIELKSERTELANCIEGSLAGSGLNVATGEKLRVPRERSLRSKSRAKRFSNRKRDSKAGPEEAPLTTGADPEGQMLDFSANIYSEASERSATSTVAK
jgi:hypothetical protein